MENSNDSKKKINLSEKLNFDKIDLTAPEVVISEILSQIPEQTNNIIFGDIKNYTGHVKSYKYEEEPVFKSNILDFPLMKKEEPKIITVDVQNSLGAIHDEIKKFECFLYTNIFPDYKYRLFFVEYSIAKYPVELIVEQSITRSISRYVKDNIFTCNNRDELEELVCEILNCKKTISVMQEIIRIAQVKEQESATSHDEK